MVENLFLQVLNMSYIGGIVILFVLGARIILKKAPKIFSYLLWIVVLIRLVFPFSFESFFSFIPVNPTPISNDILYTQTPQINTGISNSINGLLPAGDVLSSVNPMQIWINIGSMIWIIGFFLFLIYGYVSLVKLKRKLKDATFEKDNIYHSKIVDTPFVSGIINPKIYLPTSLSEFEKKYIILHEQTHIKRFDHVVRIISYLVLSIHWFNPMVWVAFYVSEKDMEMSCDESVIRLLGEGVKKDYSKSLLTFATGKKNFRMTPPVFGGGDTKRRIKNVINYKQPKSYIIIVAVVILLIALIGLVSNPKNDEPDLSLLNIDNFLSAMATNNNLIVETEDNGLLSISPNASFLNLFNQIGWKEKKVNSPLESAATLKFILREGYYVSFYSYEDYAMVYCEDTQEKYRYYKIPDGVYEDLHNYVLEKGKSISGEILSIADSGYISNIGALDSNQFTFAPVEWITLDDTDRIVELGIEL